MAEEGYLLPERSEELITSSTRFVLQGNQMSDAEETLRIPGELGAALWNFLVLHFFPLNLSENLSET